MHDFRAEEYASQVELVCAGLCLGVLPRLGRRLAEVLRDQVGDDAPARVATSRGSGPG